MTLLVAVGISACGALVGYGANANRIQSLETQSNLISLENRQRDAQIAQHETQLAVEEDRYKEIIRRLETIERLESAQR